MFSSRILRVAGLVIVVCIFAVSSIISFQRYSSVSHVLAVATKTGSWTASELEAELLKFLHVLELFKYQKRDADEVILRYDLLWSRLNVLMVGTNTLEVREIPGAKELILTLERRLKENEEQVSDLVSGDDISVAQLDDVFRPLVTPIRDLNVNSFSGPEKLKKLQQAHDLQQEFGLYLYGLLLSGSFLVLLVFRENARNRRQALHDGLTELPNRKCFKDHLRIVEERCRRNGLRMAVFVIDLNNFKSINDTLGHSAGDRLLKEVAVRLRRCVRSTDIVARLGGDEFAIIQGGVHDLDCCSELAKRVCEQIGKMFMLENTQVYPSASIGVSIYPDDAGQAEKLLVNADIAMYRAKKDSGVSYRFFEPAMNDDVVRRKRLSDDLRVAIKEGGLTLFYQPIVDLMTGRIDGVEALLRWHHDHYGYIPPPEVVSIAEQFMLTKPLNEWVLQQACQQNQGWISQGVAPIRMNVNISPAMYTQHDLVASVDAVLQETLMDADLLVLEVTEDTTMKDIESSPGILHRLRALGVGLALDDFGTGYSSLSHLRNMPVQKLKIDKSFVHDLNNEPKDLRFIRTIIRLAQNLGIQVVAEGIESEENLRDLLAEGCHYGQGYLYSRPQPADEIFRLLDGSVLYDFQELAQGLLREA